MSAAGMTVATLRQAEFVVLQLALPGRPAVNVGIFLLDPAAGRGYLRLKSDWSGVASGDDDTDLLESLETGLRQVSEEMGGGEFLKHLEDTFSNTIRLTARERTQVGVSFPRALAQLYERYVEPIPVRRFQTHLPVYSLRAAASRFGEDLEVEEEGWIEAPRGMALDPRVFAAHVVGPSMEPLIPDGSLCAFRAGVVGSRQGKRLLVWERSTSESGGRYTVKTYRSVKTALPGADASLGDEESWEHSEIVLEPINPAFRPMRYQPGGEGREFRVIGEFLRVLDE